MLEILLTYILGFFNLVGFETPSPTSQKPRITFIYTPAVDKYVCPLFKEMPWGGQKATTALPLPQRQKELEAQLPRLQSLWDMKGPVLFQTASDLLGSTFGYQYDFTKVMLCPNLPSWPAPRVIAVRQFMPSTPAAERWNGFEFVDVVFHEHLHMLVYRLLGWKLDTPLLKKYSNEELLTKVHLHVYAVTKATYLRLNMQKEWQQILSRTKNFMPPYHRAIQIVETEGHEAFIKEIASPAQNL